MENGFLNRGTVARAVAVALPVATVNRDRGYPTQGSLGDIARDPDEGDENIAGRLKRDGSI
jgi:hypothetical protein